MHVLIEIGALMLMVDLFNMLIHFISYLSSLLLASYLYGLVVRSHTCFTGLGIMVEYSCLNTILYTL
jgi:hypothetical protein